MKEVVTGLTINPNTVLKAYRALEADGFVEGRRGQGTFVTADAPSPLVRTAPGRCGAQLGGWFERARAAGLDDDAIAALLCRAAAIVGERGMSAVVALEATGLGRQYRSLLGAAGLHARDPGRLRRGTRRPERCGQDDAPTTSQSA